MTNSYSDLKSFLDSSEGTVHVVVETPAGSQNKYDFDPATGLLFLDRPIHSALRYPFDYGFIPNTLSMDGDPIDAVLLIPQSTFPGCVVRSRIVAVMDMEDEDGRDEKIICIPLSDPRGRHIKDLNDLSRQIQEELEHFFVHIKDLEKEKWAKVTGFRRRADAIRVVTEGAQRASSHR